MQPGGRISEMELPEAVMQAIFRRCDTCDVGRSACVDRRWCSIASDDALWKFLCAKHLDLASPSDHHGNLVVSYKEAYKIWHTNFSMYPFPLVVRTKRCWDSLKAGALFNNPEIAKSLQPGVSEEQLDNFEQDLGLKLPLSVRLLYRFCGGQDISNFYYGEFDSEEEVDTDNLGLLGGYSFYNHVVNVKFISLSNVLLLTRYFIPLWGELEAAKKWVVIAASFPLQKFFLLDCQNGSLHVGTGKLASHGEMMSCVPHSDAANKEDSMLRWLEMYSSRLNSGMYSMQDYDDLSSISLYPEISPSCSEAVSYGVQVRSSAVFVPELSMLEEENYMFTYLIRMRLLAAEDSSQMNIFDSCQLSRRHWIIRGNGMVERDVGGSAVIGEYPLLKTGGDAFKYTSCSPLRVRNGSIEGDFTFIPGSIYRPEGPEFLVKVAEFPLEVPSFIF